MDINYLLKNMPKTYLAYITEALENNINWSELKSIDVKYLATNSNLLANTFEIFEQNKKTKELLAMFNEKNVIDFFVKHNQRGNLYNYLLNLSNESFEREVKANKNTLIDFYNDVSFDNDIYPRLAKGIPKAEYASLGTCLFFENEGREHLDVKEYLKVYDKIAILKREGVLLAKDEESISTRIYFNYPLWLQLKIKNMEGDKVANVIKLFSDILISDPAIKIYK